MTRTRKQLVQWERIERDRETTRSELIRAVWVVRRFVQRAGEFTVVGDDLFFLPVDELAAFLEGMPAPVDAIPSGAQHLGVTAPCRPYTFSLAEPPQW